MIVQMRPTVGEIENQLGGPDRAKEVVFGNDEIYMGWWLTARIAMVIQYRDVSSPSLSRRQQKVPIGMSYDVNDSVHIKKSHRELTL